MIYKIPTKMALTIWRPFANKVKTLFTRCSGQELLYRRYYFRSLFSTWRMIQMNSLLKLRCQYWFLLFWPFPCRDFHFIISKINWMLHEKASYDIPWKCLMLSSHLHFLQMAKPTLHNLFSIFICVAGACTYPFASFSHYFKYYVLQKE